MSRVLIVDDEEAYCRQLQIALTPDGHEVRTASNGREAIDVGARFRPDVLISDWMLKSDIHGLHVVDVLRAVDPDIKALLITGFPSDDLRTNAKKTQVFDFIEKPFTLDRIRTAVEKAFDVQPPAQANPLLAVIEVDTDGAITFANARARELFRETRAGADAKTLEDLFSPESKLDLETATDCWIDVSPLTDRHTTWRVRSQEPVHGQSRLMVLRRQEEPPCGNLTVVEMLLGFKAPEHSRWPLEGRVLIIDDQALPRRVLVGMLESVGAACYATQTPAQALQLLENDEGIRFIVLDFDMPDTRPAATVQKIKSIRPDAVIVGNSGLDRRDDFAAIGVEFFLQKPWKPDDLINLLTGRIGNCTDCGLPIPLRRPKSGDSASSWICRNCGSRYYAVLDDDFPPDVLGNVRPADPG